MEDNTAAITGLVLSAKRVCPGTPKSSVEIIAINAAVELTANKDNLDVESRRDVDKEVVETETGLECRKVGAT